MGFPDVGILLWAVPFAIGVERLLAHFSRELAVAADADQVWGG